MIGMSGINLSDRAMRQQISSAINIVIQAARLSDGTRKLITLSEITGMEGEMVTMQDIFYFEQTGIGETGEVLGRYRASGIRPKFLSRLKAYGVDISPAIFDPGLVYEVTVPQGTVEQKAGHSR